jgi:hypothetical protein
VRRLATLVVLSSLVVSPAAAAMMKAATVEAGARSSEAVIRGVVERLAPRYSDDGSAIVTDVTIAVTSAWKGKHADGERVVVTIPGGEIGGYGEVNDGAPEFTEGEEVVVFLNRRGPRWHVNGRAMGKFHVEAGVAAPGAGQVEILPGAGKPQAEAWIGPMTVDELERRVRASR